MATRLEIKPVPKMAELRSGMCLDIADIVE